MVTMRGPRLPMLKHTNNGSDGPQNQHDHAGRQIEGQEQTTEHGEAPQSRQVVMGKDRLHRGTRLRQTQWKAKQALQFFLPGRCGTMLVVNVKLGGCHMGVELEAIYERGTLKLSRELPLQDGQKVIITIHSIGSAVERLYGV